MKRVLSLLLVSLLLVPQALAAPSDEEIDRMFRNAKTVGGSVVVYLRGELYYARDYGVKHAVQRQPVDENTYFKTASITKMVTGIGLMRLVEQGKIALDTEIGGYLGFPAGNPAYRKRPLTLRQLMSHTAGLNDSGGYTSLRNTLDMLLNLKGKRTGNFKDYAPGSRYAYSNFGAGVTGALMEAVSGKSINSLMREEVFAPMGIDAAYAASLLSSPADLSSQHKDGKVIKSASLTLKDAYENFPDPLTHFRTTIGDLFMRSRDMARLVALLANRGTLGGVRLLSEESVLQMMAEQMALGKSVTGESPYGLFLEHNSSIVKGRTFYGHQGMSSGAILNAYFEPESQFVFVLFSNGGSLVRQSRIGKLARTMIAYFYPMAVGL